MSALTIIAPAPFRRRPSPVVAGRAVRRGRARALLVPGVAQLPGGHRRLPDGCPACSVVEPLLGEIRKQRPALHLYAFCCPLVRHVRPAPRHLVSPVRVGRHERRRPGRAHLPVDPDRGPETPVPTGAALGVAAAPSGAGVEPGVHHRRSRPDQPPALPPHHLGPGHGPQDRLPHHAARRRHRARRGNQAHSPDLRAVPAHHAARSGSPPCRRHVHRMRDGRFPHHTQRLMDLLDAATSSTPSAPVHCSIRATRICRACSRGCIMVLFRLWCSCRHWSASVWEGWHWRHGRIGGRRPCSDFWCAPPQA